MPHDLSDCNQIDTGKYCVSSKSVSDRISGYVESNSGSDSSESLHDRVTGPRRSGWPTEEWAIRTIRVAIDKSVANVKRPIIQEYRSGLLFALCQSGWQDPARLFVAKVPGLDDTSLLWTASSVPEDFDVIPECPVPDVTKQLLVLLGPEVGFPPGRRWFLDGSKRIMFNSTSLDTPVKRALYSLHGSTSRALACSYRWPVGVNPTEDVSWFQVAKSKSFWNTIQERVRMDKNTPSGGVKRSQAKSRSIQLVPIQIGGVMFLDTATIWPESTSGLRAPGHFLYQLRWRYWHPGPPAADARLLLSSIRN